MTDSFGRQGIKKVETSIRDIYVKIEKGIKPPVFLMFSIDAKEDPEYYSLIAKKKSKMKKN